MLKVFNYICTDCQHTWEQFVKGTYHPSCPQCGSLDTEKIVVSPAFKVTGQGQYSSKMEV